MCRNFMRSKLPVGKTKENISDKLVESMHPCMHKFLMCKHWRTQRMGSKGSTPIESSEFFQSVCLQNILSRLCSYTHTGKRKNVYSFHILLQLLGDFVPGPLPGLYPWTPLGNSVHQIPWPGPIT